MQCYRAIQERYTAQDGDARQDEAIVHAHTIKCVTPSPNPTQPNRQNPIQYNTSPINSYITCVDIYDLSLQLLANPQYKCDFPHQDAENMQKREETQRCEIASGRINRDHVITFPFGLL